VGCAAGGGGAGITDLLEQSLSGQGEPVFHPRGGRGKMPAGDHNPPPETWISSALRCCRRTRSSPRAAAALYACGCRDVAVPLNRAPRPV